METIDSVWINLLLVISGIVSLILIVLFVRLCGRVRDIREALFAVHGLEKVPDFERGYLFEPHKKVQRKPELTEKAA